MNDDVMEGLPLRWENFAWCFAHHGNAARAAREAGFSPRSAGPAACATAPRGTTPTTCRQWTRPSGGSATTRG